MSVQSWLFRTLQPDTTRPRLIKIIMTAHFDIIHLDDHFRFSSNDNQPVGVSSKCKWMDLSLVLDFARCLKQETVNSCFVKYKGQVKTLET